MNAIKDHELPLCMACREGPEALVALVQMGADVNARGRDGLTAIHTAAAECGPEIISTLAYLGADLEAWYRFVTPLATAAQYGNSEGVAELVRLGADIEGRCNDGQWCDSAVTGLTPLQIAVKARQDATAQQLVGLGADINKRLNNGDTFLSNVLATKEDRKEVLESLKLALRLGAEVNARNKNGTIPLHFAMTKEEVQILVEAGSEVDEAVNEDGKTPLFYATHRNLAEVIHALVRAGARVNHADKLGFTALHYACHEHHREAIEALLESGADVNMTSKNQFTPLFLAIYKPELAFLLLTAGANPNATREIERERLCFMERTFRQQVWR